MTHHESIRSTEHEWSAANERARRAGIRSVIVGMAVAPIVVVLIMLLANTVATGVERYAVAVLVVPLLGIPAGFVAWRNSDEKHRQSHALATDLEQRLTAAVNAAECEAQRREVQVRRQEFETRLANALEMAQDEPEVLSAVERALLSTLPDRSAELLLADNSHAHLIQMAASAPVGEVSECPVDSPDHCPAARRAQVQQFLDSEALDSCPKLRDRARGRCSAVCVPVSIMGRTVGVIHATGEPAAALDDTTITDLSTLSKLAGARIGLLRVMAETQLQAATDSLTGLLNRRALEHKVRALRAAEVPVVVAMADLDHFKQLNDTHGHETGDRALRLFAQVLRSTLRADDVIARYGGEEFAIVLPSCSGEQARVVLDQARDALDHAVGAAGLPAFTVSVGVVDVGDDYEDLAEVLGRADAALFEAKHNGRNRVVVHDEGGHAVAAPLTVDALDSSTWTAPSARATRSTGTGPAVAPSDAASDRTDTVTPVNDAEPVATLERVI